jgi:hypothetical protein
MFDIDDVRRSLQSEKVTDRTKGRKALLELLTSENAETLQLNAKDWRGMLAAAIEGELKEIDHLLKKQKQPEVELAAFMKKLLKYIIQKVICTPRKQTDMACKHALHIIHNTFDYSGRFRGEYRLILLDLLEPKVALSFPYPYFANIIDYLKSAIQDKSTIRADAVDLKILKASCKALVLDSSGRQALMKSLLQWCSEVLLPLTTDNQTVQSAITAAFAECGALFIAYEGPNCISMVHRYGRGLLQHVVRQLAGNRLRDLQRDSYIRFILAYFDVVASSYRWNDSHPARVAATTGTSYGNDATSFELPHRHPVCAYPPLCRGDPLYNSIDSLCAALTSEDCLRGLTVYAYNQVIQ